MSKLEELIQKYCPDGVEYRPLGDVTTMQRGTSATKGVMNEGDIPVISGGRQPAFFCNQSNRTGETITVAGSGAGAGYVQYWNKPIFVCDAFSVKGGDCLTTKFVYYVLSSIQEKIYSTKKGGGIPHVHISSIDKFEIPIPPLPVQEEIVRVLDTFTELQVELQVELQAELQKRLQQYNYYRDNLLSFEGRTDVSFVPLSTIANLYRGKVISKDYIKENPGYFPVYSSQSANDGVMGRINTYMYEGNYLTWTTDGAYAGTVFRRSGKFNITNVCGLVKVINQDVDMDFLFYWLKAEAPKYVYSGMGNPKLMSNVMGTISVPLLPLTEQKRIASILDRFQALTTDLSQGLPAEIEKRRQQYEYYRDQLLTFEQAN